MVPQTKISGSINGQPFEVRSPKDSKLTGLTVEVVSHDQFGGTNRTTLKLDSLEAKMNPEIISTTADGQVKLVNAIGENILKAAATAK